MQIKTGSGTTNLLSTLKHSCKLQGIMTWLHLPQFKLDKGPLSDEYSYQSKAYTFLPTTWP